MGLEEGHDLLHDGVGCLGAVDPVFVGQQLAAADQAVDMEGLLHVLVCVAVGAVQDSVAEQDFVLGGEGEDDVWMFGELPGDLAQAYIVEVSEDDVLEAVADVVVHHQHQRFEAHRLLVGTGHFRVGCEVAELGNPAELKPWAFQPLVEGFGEGGFAIAGGTVDDDGVGHGGPLWGCSKMQNMDIILDKCV